MTQTEPERHTREDVHVLAEAFVARMRWPSLHWSTRHFDYDTAAALALLALDHAPDLIATARLKQDAMNAAREVGTTAALATKPTTRETEGAL